MRRVVYVKRGSTDCCFVVGVDKPSGMTSHDVVSRCRRIFGEKRIGHTGTLDPLATGVLPICVGPATRLSKYLTGHDKSYRVSISFGAGTDTDDSQGSIVKTGNASSNLYNQEFARRYLMSLVGCHKQLPPAYSAVKVQGQKAYEAARTGAVIALDPRDIEVYSAQLVSVESNAETGQPIWVVDFSVSKGTYIRSLARDIGVALGCPAHVSELRRLVSGNLEVQECVSLETLEEVGEAAILDPVRLLDIPFVFASDKEVAAVSNGNPLDMNCLTLYFWNKSTVQSEMCNCSSGINEFAESPQDGQLVCVVNGNELRALYRYSSANNSLIAECVFHKGVKRDAHL